MKQWQEKSFSHSRNNWWQPEICNELWTQNCKMRKCNIWEMRYLGLFSKYDLILWVLVWIILLHFQFDAKQLRYLNCFRLTCQLEVKVSDVNNCFLEKSWCDWKYWQILLEGSFDAIGNIGKFYNYCRGTLLTWFLEIVQNNCESPVSKRRKNHLLKDALRMDKITSE